MKRNQPTNRLLNQPMKENQPFTFSHHHQLCRVWGWTLSSIAKWKLRPVTSNLSYRGVPWTIENSVGSMIHHSTQGSRFNCFRNSLQLIGLDHPISHFKLKRCLKYKKCVFNIDPLIISRAHSLIYDFWESVGGEGCLKRIFGIFMHKPKRQFFKKSYVRYIRYVFTVFIRFIVFTALIQLKDKYRKLKRLKT